MSVFTPVYADVVYRDHRPDRRISVRIPTQSTTTINKTVRIYAPPGSTVIYGEIPVYSAMNGDYPSQTTIIAPSTAGFATLRMASGQCVTMGDELADGRAAVFEAPCLSRHRSQMLGFRQGRVIINGMCLQTQGSAVFGRRCTGDSMQDWRRIQNQIRLNGTNLCLQSSGWDGTGLAVSQCDGTQKQRFN